MTKIDNKGIGLVLGGKPIKALEIAIQLGIHKKLVQRHLKILEKGEYIFTKRTPYGLIIYVNKAKKRSNEIVATETTKKVLHWNEIVASKEDNVVDNLVDIPDSPSGSSEPSMKTKNENDFSDQGEKVLDLDTLEEVDEVKKSIIKARGYNPQDTDLLLRWGMEKLERKFSKPLKQKKHIVDMLIAGCSIEDIQEKWEELEESKWLSGGIDFGVVASQMDKAKPKEISNPLLYSKRK